MQPFRNALAQTFRAAARQSRFRFAPQLPFVTPLALHKSIPFSTSLLNMSEFKLKDLKSLSLKDLDKVEAEVEGVEGGKVLLLSVGGKVSAVSPNCTHFGAPLKNGVLTSEGRLTCPWHGGEL